MDIFEAGSDWRKSFVPDPDWSTQQQSAAAQKVYKLFIDLFNRDRGT